MQIDVLRDTVEGCQGPRECRPVSQLAIQTAPGRLTGAEPIKPPSGILPEAGSRVRRAASRACLTMSQAEPSIPEDAVNPSAAGMVDGLQNLEELEAPGFFGGVTAENPASYPRMKTRIGSSIPVIRFSFGSISKGCQLLRDNQDWNDTSLPAELHPPTTNMLQESSKKRFAAENDRE